MSSILCVDKNSLSLKFNILDLFFSDVFLERGRERIEYKLKSIL